MTPVNELSSHLDNPERAVLVHQRLKGSVTDSDFEELSGLAESAGGCVVACIGATRRAPEARTFVGRGKAQEIADTVAARCADLVIIDQHGDPFELILRDHNLRPTCTDHAGTRQQEKRRENHVP